ncbi:Glycosyl transferases group 1 [compost metagenome]
MRVDSTFRVMWLLNHTSARKFEVAMLKAIGVNEIYTPKIFPSDPSFRSASVDYSEDANLSISHDDLEKLNSVNWYESPKPQDWEIANKYFDVCFFIVHNIETIKTASRFFHGSLLWRAYGQPHDINYTRILQSLSKDIGNKWIQSVGSRFYFAQAYEHLASAEDHFLQSRSLLLPLGMMDAQPTNTWEGNDPTILFVCPDIACNPYYRKIYDAFTSDFSGLPYKIAGAQPLEVDDKNVLGFVTAEEHQGNMTQSRVMFYHSQEPFHIHYHPFEAMKVGMPLVFMAGGLLDRLGGVDLPGRCTSIKEARNKVTRILAGDSALIDSIRGSQAVLLEAMLFERHEPVWCSAFDRIRQDMMRLHEEHLQRKPRPKRTRIAVVVPIAYRGGSLRGAQLLAQAIELGSQQHGEPCEVVLVHLEKGYSDSDFADLPASIKRRTFNWKTLQASEARRAMRYSGYSGWEPTANNYLVMDDGIKHLQDCDLWVIISDRLTGQLLPTRPVVHMVYDYLQRYVDINPGHSDQTFLEAARSADQIWVTTEFTRRDAIQYAGIPPEKVMKLPMLAPTFKRQASAQNLENRRYFIWTTNATPHKNQENAFKALEYYYTELSGSLECVITGVNSKKLLSDPPKHLQDLMARLEDNETLTSQLSWPGDLPDREYQRVLSNAAFLWHAGRVDNGTFSVIEAASLGVPSLSSRYPAMEEIESQFSLNLAWMDASDPIAMAHALKDMESTYLTRKTLLPTAEQLSTNSTDQLAGAYWEAVRQCL